MVEAVNPPERPDSPVHPHSLTTKSKRSLDFKVLSDNVMKNVTESPVRQNISLTNGQSQLDNSFIVPLEDSFTESTEAESLKRTICSLDSSPGNGKFVHEKFVHGIVMCCFCHKLTNRIVACLLSIICAIVLCTCR